VLVAFSSVSNEIVASVVVASFTMFETSGAVVSCTTISTVVNELSLDVLVFPEASSITIM